MKKKELYETPSVETYDLVPEGAVLQGSLRGTAGQNDTVNDLTQDANGNDLIY